MNPSKRRGTAFETRVVKMLQAFGFGEAARAPLSGKNDKGDILGIKNWTLELKNRKQWALAQAMDEAKRESQVGKTSFYAVVANRNRSPINRAYAVMELSQLLNIIAMLEELEELQHKVSDAQR